MTKATHFVTQESCRAKMMKTGTKTRRAMVSTFGRFTTGTAEPR